MNNNNNNTGNTQETNEYMMSAINSQRNKRETSLAFKYRRLTSLLIETDLRLSGYYCA
jgi:hypothetical protein